MNGKDCIFPFIYKGEQYDRCTTIDAPMTPWCSTENDENNNYIGYYGDCAEQCSDGPDSGNIQFLAHHRKI